MFGQSGFDSKSPTDRSKPLKRNDLAVHDFTPPPAAAA
jgi:hypothetical protein